MSHSQFLHHENVQLESNDESVKLLTLEAFWIYNQGHVVVAWLKLYKTSLFSLFESVRYSEGKLYEDEFITYKLLFPQERIAFFCFKDLYVLSFSR